MSLAAPMTLGEARQSVLIRAGLGIQGNQSANAHPMVDELLRSAVRQLFVEAAWTVLQKEVQITLTEGQSEVDWPDDSEPGAILFMAAVNSAGRQVEISPGLRLPERDSARIATSRPVTYYFHDGSIFLQPGANDDWLTLLVNYTASPGDLTEDDAEIPVDPEAAIQHATLAYKRYWNLPVTNIDEARFQRYIDQIRANQSEGEGFIFGGRKSSGTHRVNRIARNRQYGNGVPYQSDWNPF